MSYQKQFQEGPVSITISSDGATASIDASVSASLGGGAVAGAVSVSNDTKITVEDQILIDAGFGIAEAKWPSVAPFLKAAQAEIDAQLAKVGT